MSQQYFKRYIERVLREGRRSEYFKPFVGWIKRRADKLQYSEHRPWTEEFKKDQFPMNKRPKVYLEPISEWKIFKGDRVQILVGKDKGKVGIVNSIVKERNWCFVAGLNVVSSRFFMLL
jgi:large subunit ribosomal protein L24